MNERDIFEKAIEIRDRSPRDAFLDQACGADAALRKRLDELLASHDQASGFLNVPVVDQIPPSEMRGHHPTIELSQTAGAASPAAADDDHDDEAPGAADLSFLQPSTKPGSIGRMGHYEILQVLGQGAFGIVFKAFDEKLHRHVAVKAMSPQLAATSPPRKRFLREARSVAALKHENIVQVHSVEEQPLPYLVMEYVDGQTLQQKLDGSGPFDLHEILHLGRQMAAGLAAAHEKGLIHRDIKPGNILLEAGAEQKVKITDFGLARAADDATMTRTGTIAGTPMYMAPEQALGQDLDHRADLFSLGSVLYQMACGRAPFRGPTAVAVLKRVVDETPRPIRQILPDVPSWLCAIIEKLHAKNPDERYQSAKEVADLLARCQTRLQQNRRVELPDDPAAFLSKPVDGTKPEPVVTDNIPEKPAALPPTRGSRLRWTAAAALVLMLLVGVSLTEATGITNVRGTVVRLFSPDGTLVVEVSKEPGPIEPATSTDMQTAAFFNGKDLTGWTGMKQYWRVKDGAIVGMHNGNLVHHTFLCTERSYGDFELNFKIRIKGGKGNSGVQIRSKLVDSEKYHVSGPQADAGAIGRDYWGVLWGQDIGGMMAEPNPDAVHTAVKTDDFNDYSIKVVGTRFTIKINGTTMVDDDFEKSRDGRFDIPTEGIIALQLHPGPAMEVTFKDFRFKELGPAPVLLDRRPQFRMGGEWRVEGNELVQTSPNNAAILFGDRNWTDYDFEVELNSQGKTKDGHGAGVLYRATDLTNFFDLQIGGWSATVSEVTFLKNQKWGRVPGTFLQVPHEHDRWYKAKVEVRGPKIRCSVDGKELFVFEDADLPKGMVGLSNGNSPVRWRNLKVTAPDGRVLWEGFPDLGPAAPQAAPATDPDRRAAEWVLSVGGSVRVNGLEQDIKTVDALPNQPFVLSMIGLNPQTPKQLTDEGLALFKNCVGLKALYMNGALVTDTYLAHFHNCKNLTDLRLTFTRVTDAGLANFKDCKRLTTLDLSGTTAVSDTGIAHFNGCKNLIELWLYQTSITDAGLVNFRDCKQLASLRLEATQVTDKGLFHFSDCKLLYNLCLNRTQVTDAGLTHFKDCKLLKFVILPETQVTGSGLAQFKDCNYLHIIDLTGTPIGDDGLKELAKVTKLVSVHLKKTKVTAAGIDALKKALPKCVIVWDGGLIDPMKIATDADRKAAEWVLSIGGKVRVNGQEREVDAITALPQERVLLTSFNLRENQNANDAGLAHFKDCKNLKQIDLYSTKVNDAGLVNFKDCNKVAGLNLAGTLVTDAGLAYFRDCKDLVDLNLVNTSGD